jgi:hypothetical protein
MNLHRFSIVLFLILTSLQLINAGTDSTNLSNEQVFYTIDGRYASVDGNVALAGVDTKYLLGMYLPFFNVSAGVQSDKLAITPFNQYVLDSLQSYVRLFNKVIRKSFNIDGLNETEVSDKLTEEFKHGVRILTGLKLHIANASIQRFAFDITTHFDEDLHLPAAPFLILFSRDKGLLRGTTLTFDDFSQSSVWATDFSVRYGLPFSNDFLKRVFGFKYSAAGFGIKYVLGHSLMMAETERGNITYNTASNSIDMSSDIHVYTAGFGFHGNRDIDGFKFPAAGHGGGIDLGGILYDERGAFSLQVQNLGALFWVNDVHDITYKIRKKDFTVYDLITAIDDAGGSWDSAKLRIFNRNNGDYLPDTNDALKECKTVTTALPAVFSASYLRSWDFFGNKYQKLHLLSQYVNASVAYSQGLTRSPGSSFVPRFKLLGENGFLKGYVPLQIGFVAGGREKFASEATIGVNTDQFHFSCTYRAIGTAYFAPKRGMELGSYIALTWGKPRDRDNDSIIDKFDNCKKEAEDRDGYLDTDGCPDYDNDMDSIPDTLDKCSNEPEDYDGFNDDDGCPDPDNELDSIPDSLDKCINLMEDRDGFEDTDGCPDYDNDMDSIPDTLDKCVNEPEDRDGVDDTDGCPDIDRDSDGFVDSLDKCDSLAEDIDGFEDTDGCPDTDNDQDSIPDTLDKCKDIPENINGFEDSDGCRDSISQPSESEVSLLTRLLRTIAFQKDQSVNISVSRIPLDSLIEIVKKYPSVYFVAGIDTASINTMDLIPLCKRYLSIKDYCKNLGVPENQFICGIQDGKTSVVSGAVRLKKAQLMNALSISVVLLGSYAAMAEKEKTLFSGIGLK